MTKMTKAPTTSIPICIIFTAILLSCTILSYHRLPNLEKDVTGITPANHYIKKMGLPDDVTPKS